MNYIKFICVSVLFVSLGIAAAGGCNSSGGGQGEESTQGPPPAEEVIVRLPLLLTPVNKDAIEQNNPSIGCPLDRFSGYGHRIFFDWTDSSSPNGIRGYHLFVRNINATLPLIDTFVLESEYTDTSCNSFVIDSNLEGWIWSVQAEDNQGNLSPFSTGEFVFERCRLVNGAPCISPPLPVSEADVTAPVLLTPINNVLIEQNSPGIGCSFNETFGFGFRVFFDWTDSSSPNQIWRYYLVVMGDTAIFPLVDTIVFDSEFTLTSCNSFIADFNLNNWKWSVQAEDFFGNLSPVVEGVFSFEPCRHANGTSCFAR